MNTRLNFEAHFRIEQEHVQLSAGMPVRAQSLFAESVLPHDHSYHEVCLIISGTATHITAQGRMPLGKGDVFVVPPDIVHAIEDTDNLQLINTYYLSEWLMHDLGLLWSEPGAVPLFLSNSLMRNRGPRLVQFHLEDWEFDGLHSELVDIENEGERKNPSLLFLRCCLQKSIATMSRAWTREDPIRSKVIMRPEIWRAMKEIEMAVNNGNSFSVADNSQKSNMSADHFSSLFKTDTGFAPMDYFQRRRVHRSCQMLLNPRPSITEIAMDLGFSDAPHFCRMFKRYKEMTPSQYRKVYQV